AAPLPDRGDAETPGRHVVRGDRDHPQSAARNREGTHPPGPRAAARAHRGTEPMKRRCPESAGVQDFLDDLMPPLAAERFRRHLEGCAECAGELAAYRRVFGAIERVRLLDPGPRLSERILAAVLPSSIRRRWIKTVGWTYAGSLAASVAGAFALASLPGSRTWLDTATATASQHTVQLVL